MRRHANRVVQTLDAAGEILVVPWGDGAVGKLARSLKSASGDLSNLRLLLSSLRERANEIRAAVA